MNVKAALGSFFALLLLAGEHAALAQPENAEGVVKTVGFEVLASFPYQWSPDDPTLKPPIPDSVRALDEKRVAITGYLLPLQVENGLARQAILLRDLMSCCYGVPPNFNEFVIVRVAGAGLRPVMDTPVTMVGTLRVGEAYEEGYFIGIYQLEAESLTTANN